MNSVVSLALAGSMLLPSQPSSDWARVRSINAGARIRAVYIGRRQDQQYFVAATDEAMTLLTPEHLPRVARKAVIEIAATQPGFFSATKWMEFTDGPVRINPDGIWLKGHRIAAIQDVVTTVERGDVAEVSQEIVVPRRRQPTLPGQLDPDGQTAAMSGVGSGLLVAAACKENCPNW